MNQIFVCLLLGIAAANASGQNPITIVVDIFLNNVPPSQAGINQQMDQCLVEVKDLIKTNGLYKNFNPLSLPDITENILFSQIKLTEVELYGFDSIYRYGDVIITYDASYFYLKMQHGFKKLRLDSNYALKIISQTTGTLSAHISNFVYSFSTRIDRTTFKVDLTGFKVIQNGSIDMKLKGAEQKDSFAASLVNLLSSSFKENGLVGREVKLVIAGLIDQHNKAV